MDIQYGEKRKCPGCGAFVPGGVVYCKECGYEFVNVGPVSSSQKLSELIDRAAAKDDAKNTARTQMFTASRHLAVAQVIKNFPIPNTCEDLLEFCLMCEARGENNKTFPIEYAYYQKYLEAVNKAKVYFPNDTRFQALFQRCSGKSKKMEESKKTMLYFHILGLILFILAAIMTFATL